MLRAESSSIREAIALIKQAKKPIILAGHGIVESGAEREVLAFAESQQIPIATTLLGLGCIPAAHPLQLGMMGMHGESWVNNAIQNADLLLAFGMRFDDRVTGNLASYSPNSKKIHIEIDPSEINKNVRADVALIGDLKEVLQLLLPLLTQSSRKDASWLKEINASKGTPRARHHQPARQRPPLRRARHPRHLARGAGRRPPQRHHHRHRRGPAPDVGGAVLQARGAALARHLRRPRHDGLRAARGHRREGRRCPDKDVWVIAGDGGFQMTAAELSTIVQEGLAINIAVINNGFLGMVRQWQETFYDKNYSASPILSPDFVMLAAAHGIAGAT
jgi:acetolactate synthase-1/2/3 large subunit